MKSKRIFDYVRDVNVALIFNGGENHIDKTFFYLTEAKSGIFEDSALYVKSGEIKIITSELEETAARETGFDILTFKNRNEFSEILKKLFEKDITIGINYSSLTLELYKDILNIIPDKEFIDISQSIFEARKIKEEDEIKKIREAARLASDSFKDVLQKIREGMTETEVASEMVYAMMKNGASGESFNTIVGFGKNSAIPHYSPGKYKLRKNDFVLIDYGALYQRYSSDITRTFIFGKASEEQKMMYETVKKAQSESMKSIKENENGRSIDKIARDIIDSTKYKGRFIHSLGHGVGMDVHDHSALSPSYDFILKSNMVVTDEPGIYIPGFGGVRIEDDVLVKKDGYEQITTAPKDLIEL